jgi:hypothetical protein
MGTQQILMIVLSVIVVGAAVAVGIQMFDSQAVNSARSAIYSDFNNYAAQTLAYWRTPTTMGGGGNSIPSAAALGTYLGFNLAADGIAEGTVAYKNANGLYVITVTNPGLATATATITCTPNEKKITADATVTINPSATTETTRIAVSAF